MQRHAGFRLGPFSVDSGGRLAAADMAEMPSFRLLWRRRLIHVRMSGVGPEVTGFLAVQAVLGRVPSTARGDREDQSRSRRRAFAVLRGLPAALPRHWLVRLHADHRIGLKAELPLSLPAASTALIAEVSQFLLAVSPYLDALDEAGMAPGIENI